jgi:guanosine-3',5'-bis(diphosphate) 3'-pyrophosphohydrolase
MYEITASTPAALTLIQASLSPADAERIECAYRFAAAAHKNQKRDEGTPFIEHPVRVATILWDELGSRDVELLMAALNHDAIEDCDEIDAELVASAFGDRVARLVVDVTKDPAGPEGREARDLAYMEHLSTLPHDSRLLKLADRIDNLRSIMNAGDEAKAIRYLTVSREKFLPLAMATDPVANRLIGEACDAIAQALGEE